MRELDENLDGGGRGDIQSDAIESKNEAMSEDSDEISNSYGKDLS